MMTTPLLLSNSLIQLNNEPSKFDKCQVQQKVLEARRNGNCPSWR